MKNEEQFAAGAETAALPAPKLLKPFNWPSDATGDSGFKTDLLWNKNENVIKLKPQWQRRDADGELKTRRAAIHCCGRCVGRWFCWERITAVITMRGWIILAAHFQVSVESFLSGGPVLCRRVVIRDLTAPNSTIKSSMCGCCATQRWAQTTLISWSLPIVDSAVMKHLQTPKIISFPKGSNENNLTASAESTFQLNHHQGHGYNDNVFLRSVKCVLPNTDLSIFNTIINT